MCISLLVANVILGPTRRSFLSFSRGCASSYHCIHGRADVIHPIITSSSRWDRTCIGSFVPRLMRTRSWVLGVQTFSRESALPSHWGACRRHPIITSRCARNDVYRVFVPRLIRTWSLLGPDLRSPVFSRGNGTPWVVPLARASIEARRPSVGFGNRATLCVCVRACVRLRRPLDRALGCTPWPWCRFAFLLLFYFSFFFHCHVWVLTTRRPEAPCVCASVFDCVDHSICHCHTFHNAARFFSFFFSFIVCARACVRLRRPLDRPSTCTP